MKIKNWHELQHFKDRTPPWIKLYRNILDQRDISVISDCSFRVLIGLWLLASEDKALAGNLPEIPDIAFRLRKTEKEIAQCLQELDAFIEYDDASLISERYQDDAPETEAYSKETYREETEKEVLAKKPKKSPMDLYIEIANFDKFWESYGKIGNKQQAIKSYNKTIKGGTTHETIINGLRRYQDYCQAIGQEQRYIKHASTWLNNRGWEDENRVQQHVNRNDKHQRTLDAATRGHMRAENPDF